MIGKNQDIKSDDIIYSSKCGRYEITKTMVNNGGRNGHYTTGSYKFTVIASGKVTKCENFTDAKEWAEVDNDPEWDCE